MKFNNLLTLVFLIVPIFAISQTKDIIIDAGDLLGQIPKGHTISDSRSLRVERVFNNLAISFKTPASFTIPNYIKDVNITADGKYYLYVRAIGSGNGAFRVRLDNKYADGEFGKIKGPSFIKSGPYELKKGRVPLLVTRITGTPSLDVIVLSTNPNLSEDELFKQQFTEELAMLKEYDIPQVSCVKFGDMTADGNTDLLAFTSNYSAIVIDNSGKELWHWEAPEERSKLRAEFEAPGAVWDIDKDGKAEAIHWREFDGKEWLVVADGKTGDIKYKTEWETAPHPHVYNNFRIAIGRLSGEYPQNIIVYTDCGVYQNITAYSPTLEKLWSHKEMRKKDHLGHYVYPRDLMGKGYDQVLGGSVMLDKDGKVIWNLLDDIYDNHDHIDSYKFADINGDGKDEIVIAGCDLGVMIMNAANADIIWQRPAAHTQQIQSGMFLSGYDKPQIAAGARIYGDRKFEPYISGQIHWFDAEGNAISQWPSSPLNGNPDFSKGDWYGDGSEVLFWYKFKIEKDGKGKLLFPDQVYHCFDFMRNGAAQVITLDNGKVRVWGYSAVKSKKANNNPDYMKNTITNHTHY